MARPVNVTPSCLLHRRSGKARVVVHDHDGSRKEILLPGPFDSDESRAEYNRLCALLRTHGGRLPAPARAGGSPADLTVAELVLRYMREHASVYYRDPVTGQPAGEVDCLRLAFRPLNRLFGPVPVGEFDSLKLESLQTAMATGSWLNDEERAKKEKKGRPLGMSRVTVNQHVDRVKRLYRWGCAKRVVPADVLVNLESVASLKPHRSPARDTPPVVPVEPDVVEATLPYMPATPADMVRVLLLTGARVGELCQMRTGDLDRAGPVWLFTPEKHKTAHRGHRRVIALGPKAQLILRRYLKDGDPDAYLFSPAEEDARRKAEMRAARKTPVQPSQVDRSRPGAGRKLGPCYTSRAVNHAIRRACLKAGVPLWHTHQTRHAAALLFMREHGAEAARSALGHKALNMTTFYAGIDLQRAAEIRLAGQSGQSPAMARRKRCMSDLLAYLPPTVPQRNSGAGRSRSPTGASVSRRTRCRLRFCLLGISIVPRPDPAGPQERAGRSSPAARAGRPRSPASAARRQPG